MDESLKTRKRPLSTADCGNRVPLQLSRRMVDSVGTVADALRTMKRSKFGAMILCYSLFTPKDQETSALLFAGCFQMEAFE